MIKTKILLKAMSFMFVPTLAVFIFLFFWFLDFHAFLSFITDKRGGGSFLRVLLLLLETVCVKIMYNNMLKKDVLENPAEYYSKEKYMNSYTHVKDLFKGDRDSKYYTCKIPNSNLVLVECKP